MSKIGFIGYGHMGGALLRSLLASGAIDSKDVVIATRTKSKLAELSAQYPDIEIADGNRAVAAKCKRIFICMGTYDAAQVMQGIRDLIDETTHIVFICGGLEIKSMEEVFCGKITKIIPSLVCEAQEGVTLVCCNSKVDGEEKNWIKTVLEKVGKVRFVREDQFEVGSVLTSCAPALIAAMLDQFGLSAERYGSFTREETLQLLLYTCLGTAELLVQTGENFKQMAGRVATKGGSTEQGVQVLEERLPAVFNEMFQKALGSHTTRKEKTRKQFADAKATMDARNN